VCIVPAHTTSGWLERPSVLHVIAGLADSGGGTSRSVPNQCFSTVDAGFRVSIAFVHRGEELSREAADLTRRGVGTLIVRPLSALPRLWRIVGRHDIVHVNGIWSPLCHLGALYARLQKKPVVITPHGMLEPWALEAKYMKKAMGLWLYQRRDLEKASVLQATSEDEAKHIRAIGLMTPTAVIPNGVSVPSSGDLGRRPSGRSRRLLFLSRIHPKKGVLELVRAVAALRRTLERGRWIVTIAGPDENRHLASVQKEASRLGVADLVEFRGAIDGKPKWDLYRSADLFVLPTYSENFGMVIAEAMGCGVPVVTTQGTPWGELVTRKCGWWHPVGQRELERTVEKALLTPRGVLRQMGDRGRTLVLAKYGWPRVGMRLKEVYNWLLGLAPCPPSVCGG